MSDEKQEDPVEVKPPAEQDGQEVTGDVPQPPPESPKEGVMLYMARVDQAGRLTGQVVPVGVIPKEGASESIHRFVTDNYDSMAGQVAFTIGLQGSMTMHPQITIGPPLVEHVGTPA